MARRIGFITFIGIILCSIEVFTSGVLDPPVQEHNTTVDAAARQQILGSTVRLALFAPALDEMGQEQILEVNGEKQRELIVAEGLGTLVQADGEQLIVTHDHWSLLNEKLYKVHIHSAGNERLLELTGSEFLSLIRYRDGGTLILTAPEPMSSQLNGVTPAGEDVVLELGATLLVAYWQPASSATISVEPVVIEAIEPYLGRPSIKIRSLNGLIVVPGNSGGGVYLRGQLVGSISTTIMELHRPVNEENGVMVPTTLSQALRLP